jgi:hypothetical protein
MTGIPGKYIHEKTGSHYIELKPDGTYFLFDGSAGVTGTYDVDGAEIKIFVGESTSQGQIENGVIIDDEGEKWVRTQSTAETGGTTKVVKCRNCNSDVPETVKFCSNCGAQVGKVEPTLITRNLQPVPRRAPQAQVTTSRASSDDPLPSMLWLPPILRREDFPWELIEAAGWFVLLVLVFMSAITKRP